LPSEGDDRDAQPGEECVQDAVAVLPEKAAQARRDRIPSKPILDPSLAVHRLQRAEEEIERRDDEEQRERIVIGIGRGAPLEMPDADREQQRGDEPGPPAERLFRQRVRREDRQGAEEARAEQEREHDRFPRVPEQRREEPADEEGEPREERRSRIRQGEWIAQHRIPAQVLSRLERITKGAMPVVRV